MNSADQHNSSKDQAMQVLAKPESMTISLNFKEWLQIKSYIEYVESRIARREIPPTEHEYELMCRSMERTNGD